MDGNSKYVIKEMESQNDKINRILELNSRIPAKYELPDELKPTNLPERIFQDKRGKRWTIEQVNNRNLRVEWVNQQECLEAESALFDKTITFLENKLKEIN